jgi:hypothetical protein
MTRKEKIALIKVGIKPVKEARYKLFGIQNRNGTFNVKGEDLLKNVCIDGIYSREQINEMGKANGDFKNSIHVLTFIDFGAKNVNKNLHSELSKT